MSLVDRSFEEVCSIMDRTGEVAELLVEHATDFRMCDLLEDGGPANSGSGGGGFGGMAGAGGPRKSGDGAGLGLVAGKYTFCMQLLFPDCCTPEVFVLKNKIYVRM
jgi:hypothetical protein